LLENGIWAGEENKCYLQIKDFEINKGRFLPCGSPANRAYFRILFQILYLEDLSEGKGLNFHEVGLNGKPNAFLHKIKIRNS